MGWAGWRCDDSGTAGSGTAVDGNRSLRACGTRFPCDYFPHTIQCRGIVLTSVFLHVRFSLGCAMIAQLSCNCRAAQRSRSVEELFDCVVRLREIIFVCLRAVCPCPSVCLSLSVVSEKRCFVFDMYAVWWRIRVLHNWNVVWWRKSVCVSDTEHDVSYEQCVCFRHETQVDEECVLHMAHSVMMRKCFVSDTEDDKIWVVKSVCCRHGTQLDEECFRHGTRSDEGRVFSFRHRAQCETVFVSDIECSVGKNACFRHGT